MVAHFEGDVILQALDRSGRRQLYRLLAPLRFYSVEHGQTFVVPAGFTSDLASVPWLADFVIDDDSPKTLRAAIVHDWLYATGLVSRHAADQILIEGMVVLGANRFQRWAVYAFVRAFGWWSWWGHELDRIPV